MPNPESDFNLERGVLRFKEEANLISAWVPGPIINPAQKQKKGERGAKEMDEWKERVESVVRKERGDAWWDPDLLYAVTLQFGFHPRRTTPDVDNLVKPVLDKLARGLGVDDSSFRNLLIHRLPDVKSPGEEGLRLFVSSPWHAQPD